MIVGRRRVWIGIIYGITTLSGTTAPVVVSDGGQLGTLASERFKKDIAAMDNASEAILSPRSVTFHYKSDTKDTQQFGLTATFVSSGGNHLARLSDLKSVGPYRPVPVRVRPSARPTDLILPGECIAKRNSYFDTLP
jgi:Chaperone of endosialidase